MLQTCTLTIENDQKTNSSLFQFFEKGNFLINNIFISTLTRGSTRFGASKKFGTQLLGLGRKI